ncbi:MAG: family 10 glycosylhydrolase [Chroococcidiopsidaceae cyanobacterium CP_BM_ER_R8_30]|nr:family 10 glycosylhydrolase [Chroococcidiopsidaceae cyanobacterium CP_BM_ER_R8_30]
MSNRPLKVVPTFTTLRRLILAVFTSSLASSHFCIRLAQAQTLAYCQLPVEVRQEKANLLQASLKGNQDAQNRYEALLSEQAGELQQCRSHTWPPTQAIWLRLYPCDIQPGFLDQVLDRIVNRGYNQVYIDTFSDGQVLLPASDNPTVWPAVVRVPGAENTDLLAQAIQKAHERGLKAYAWMFLMNFGYSYSQRPDRQSVLAQNGKRKTSQDVIADGSQVFVDPYNLQAKRDYHQLVQQVIQRHPDGVLFDYVRYPGQSGSDGVATNVKDLWIYSDAAKQALLQRALNDKGRELLQRFLTQGYISVGDIEAVDQLYPQQQEPLWQGRVVPPLPPPTEPLPTPVQEQPLLQWQLWQLSVAHALQGILDFLAVATLPVQQQGIPAGAIFFPEGNAAVGQGGYDSRLQPWDRFPSTIEWHPMSYATCGDTSCIVAEVQRVLKYAPAGTQVSPVLAGVWGQAVDNRPSLEAQMQAIHQAAPQIQSVSHFAFSWQEPQLANQRKFCQLQYVHRLQESDHIP